MDSNRRGGFSMMEIIITMTIASAIMAVNVVWLHHSMSFSRQMKNRQQHHQQLTRLSRQFRDDVRGSEKVSVKDNELILETDNKTITYTISENAILFEEKMVTDSDSARRERFSFYKHSAAEWDPSELPNWITLVVRRLPETPQHVSVTPETKPEVVDLHVRVSPNRWPGVEVNRSPINDVRDATDEEAQK